MKIAFEPFMHRPLSLEELPRKVRELGYEWIELSPRGDFLECLKAPRVFPDRIEAFKKALAAEGVKIASVLAMYRSFDGIMTACVFAWQGKADESSRFMRAEMQRYVDKYGSAK